MGFIFVKIIIYCMQFYIDNTWMKVLFGKLRVGWKVKMQIYVYQMPFDRTCWCVWCSSMFNSGTNNNKIDNHTNTKTINDVF